MNVAVIVDKSEEEIRREITRTALCHMHFLLDTLCRERQDESQDGICRMDVLWPTLMRRINELGSAALSAVDDEVAEVQELADVVFGPAARLAS